METFKTEISELNIEIEKNERVSDENTRKLNETEIRLSEVEKELEKLESLHSDLDKKKEVIEEKREELNVLDILIERLKSKYDETSKDSQLISYLKSKIKGFKGRFGDLFYPLDPRFRLPLRVLLGKTMDFLVVEDNETSVIVNDLLKERFKRKTLIVLENIPRITNSTLKKQRVDLAGVGTPAFDIVNVREENEFIRDALKYFLCNKFCTETLEQARQAKIKLGKGRKYQFATIGGDKLSGNLISSVGDSEKFFEDKRTNPELEKRLTDLENKKIALNEEIVSLLSKE